MRAILLCLALASSEVYGACSTCLFSTVAGNIKEECDDTTSSITCLNGKQIKVEARDGSSISIDRATCLGGEWFGGSCGGGLYELTIEPVFDCGKESPALPEGCACAFENAGEVLNYADPISSCLNNVNHVVQCDDKIFVKNGSELVGYNSVTCTGGQWFGSNCDGTLSALQSASVSVQCGSHDEPFFPSQLPHRGGLRFFGTVGGYKRYGCGDNEIVKFKILYNTYYYYAHAKFVECDGLNCRIASSNGQTQVVGPIEEVSCRNYGTLNSICSIPWANGAWWQDGTIMCGQGGYATITYFDVSNTLKSVDKTLNTATCGIDGWSIAGTSITGVQLATFWCYGIPSKTGTCSALNFTSTNVQYLSLSGAYQCSSTVAEEMAIKTPSGDAYHGNNLQCVSGEWKLTQSSAGVVVIPPGSSVSCVPILTNVLPSTNFPLTYAGRTRDGLQRWTCMDSIIATEANFNPQMGGKLPIHAPYIETNNSFVRATSSLGEYSLSYDNSINTISCLDVGAKHAACTEPVSVGALRKGNSYACQKGFYMHNINYVDSMGNEHTIGGDTVDTKSMQCQKDGWQIQGTSLSGLRVTLFHCYTVQLYLSETGCPRMKFAFYTLQFDRFRQYYSCPGSEKLGYTLNGVEILGAGKKLYCGKNGSGAKEWQWSAMDGTNAAAVPLQATIGCF